MIAKLIALRLQRDTLFEIEMKAAKLNSYCEVNMEIFFNYFQVFKRDYLV